MSKFKVGNPWKTGKTSSERRKIWATDEKASREAAVVFLRTSEIPDMEGFKRGQKRGKI